MKLSSSGEKRPFRMHNSRDLRVDIRSLPKLLMVVSMGTLLGMLSSGSRLLSKSSRSPHLALKSPQIRKSPEW